MPGCWSSLIASSFGDRERRWGVGMQWVAAATILVGLVAVIAGLVLGVRRLVRSERDPHLQGGLPEAPIRLLEAILAAPLDRAFFVGGIFLVVLGVALFLAI